MEAGMSVEQFVVCMFVILVIAAVVAYIAEAN
jgi:hypothetical protein